MQSELVSLNVIDGNSFQCFHSLLNVLLFSSLLFSLIQSCSSLLSFSIRSCSSLLSSLIQSSFLSSSIRSCSFSPLQKSLSYFILVCFHLRSNLLHFNTEILHLCDYSFLHFSSISCLFFSLTLIHGPFVQLFLCIGNLDCPSNSYRVSFITLLEDNS